MIFIDELYRKTVADNETNLKFWGDYLKSLKSLNFEVYAERLKVPVLVPIGNKIFFRGEVKHTNEVTVSLGADYFVKCSVAQAEVLRQHRIKDAESKIDLYRKEKEYLETQISFTKENVYKKDGQEILEVYSEEEDKAWREKHRENVRKYKQEKCKEPKSKDEIPDEEFWERLEELELQEELENELLDNYNEIVYKRKDNTFLKNQQTLLLNSLKKENNTDKEEAIQSMYQENSDNIGGKDLKLNKNVAGVIVTEKSHAIEPAKHDLLQQVLEKQNELEIKLHKLKYRERESNKTEQDLIAKLDELEQLDELEDEMERLDDILQTEDEEIDNSDEDTNNSENESNHSDPSKLKKSISFADDGDSETIEINFTHSDTQPNKNPFNAERGISKPSDFYEAYSHLFDGKTTSILKKSKYGPEVEKKEVKPIVKEPKQVKFDESVEDPENTELEKHLADRTIVIKDVVEKVAVNQHKIEGGARPTSLFKQRRMQNKS